MVMMLSSTAKCIGVSGHNFIAYIIIYAMMIMMRTIIEE